MTADHGVTFRDRERLSRTRAHETALDCLNAGIEAALPERLIRTAVSVDDGRLRIEGVDGAVGTYDLAAHDRIVLLGAGKAAAGAAGALEGVLDRAGRGVDEGVVVTDGATDEAGERPPDAPSPAAIDVCPGDHPLPSERGVESTRRVLDAAARVTESDLVLAVVTGGASALLAAPAGPLSVDDLRALTSGLLASGASIEEINAVRKHCSAVKGGQVARAVAPATTVTFAVSDVIGDPLATIGSGPTVPDPSTYADALAVLDRYALDAPAAVRDHLRAGRDGRVPETPSEGDPAFDRSATFVVGNGRSALDAAATAAATRGYEPLVLSASVRGEAREAGTAHAAIAEECVARGSPVEPPAVLLSGGETTVTLEDAPDPGIGGPNAEFAAGAALALATGPLGDGSEARDGETKPEAAASRVVVASVDTDGRDGPTDAAGALADATTLDPERARDALDRHDVYPCFDEAGALLRTGATGTNVNDLRAVVVEPEDAPTRRYSNR